MKKILLICVWFSGTFLTLIMSLTTLYFVNNVKSGEALLSEQAKNLATKNQYEFYAAVPQVLGTFTSVVQAADARPELIRQYLERYNSPLLPYADSVVSISDKYGLDYRLIVAIAQCESNVCKVIPEGSYNCWGYGNGKTRFDSWENAIEKVAETLKDHYIDEGLTTPELIMPKWVPPSIAKGGPWAKCVNQFMEEIR